AGRVGSHGNRLREGTVIVSRVGDASVTVAGAPFTVTAFAAGVGPNPLPVMVATIPGRSTAGSIAAMTGASAGCASAVKSTLPAPSTSACARCSPGSGPSTQTASARPSWPLAPPEIVPPPETTDQFTRTPASGAPLRSVIRTASGTLELALAGIGLGVSGSMSPGARGSTGSSHALRPTAIARPSTGHNTESRNDIQPLRGASDGRRSCPGRPVDEIPGAFPLRNGHDPNRASPAAPEEAGARASRRGTAPCGGGAGYARSPMGT